MSTGPTPRRGPDALRSLYARRQITRSQFLAATAYRRARDRSAPAEAVLSQNGWDGLSVVHRVVLHNATLADIADRGPFVDVVAIIRRSVFAG